jgi:septal ring factor EnvC (AmiA/AmiB activator)
MTWESLEQRLRRLEDALLDMRARAATLSNEVGSIRQALERERRAEIRARADDSEMAPPDPSVSAYHNPPERNR